MWKGFAEKQTIYHWMNKPKVEFYHRYISSESWPTDLKLKRAFSLDHIGTSQAYRHYEEQFKCEFTKRCADKQTINHWMYKPKVEFYHRYISSEPYGPENQEGLSIALWLYSGKVWSRSNEKRQRNRLLRIFLFFLLVTLTFTVRSWKWIGLLYFLVAIHQASFKEIGAETMEILKLKASEKERKKENNKNKKTLQKQKGLPTLSVDLKKLYKNRKVYRLCRSTLTRAAPKRIIQ